MHVVALCLATLFASPNLVLLKHRRSGQKRTTYQIPAVLQTAFARAGFRGDVKLHGFGQSFSLIGRAWPGPIATMYEQQHVFAKKQGISPRTMEYSPVGRQFVRGIQALGRTVARQAKLKKYLAPGSYLLTHRAVQMPEAVLITDGRCFPPLKRCNKAPPTIVRIFRIAFDLRAPTIGKHTVRFTKIVDLRLKGGVVVKEWYAKTASRP